MADNGHLTYNLPVKDLFINIAKYNFVVEINRPLKPAFGFSGYISVFSGGKTVILFQEFS
jgi:hypothetical protein